MGLALAFLLENLDTTLHSSKQIESLLNLKTLGRIPNMRGQKLTLRNGDTPQSEAYRSLRTNLLNWSSETPLRTLAITSAEPNEGKSTIAANLAVAIGQTGRTVVLVDCDLRRPQQHKLFNCTNDKGLCQVLTKQAPLSNVLQESFPSKVTIMTTGVLPEDTHPAELLSSEAMENLIKQLSQLCDIVILDLPAARVLADASIVSSMVDGVLLVVGRNLIKEQEVQDAYQQLQDANANVIGTVINRAESNHNYRYYARTSRTSAPATFQVADE
jgi:capsular exopolysaccharide synthesis family protein